LLTRSETIQGVSLRAPDENLMAFVELDSAIRAALHKIKNESSRQAGDNYIV